MSKEYKHPLEAEKSWDNHVKRMNERILIESLDGDNQTQDSHQDSSDPNWYLGRFLKAKSKKRHKDEKSKMKN